MTVANNIKRYRKLNNLLQKQLADKLGVSSQVISNWERGYTSPNYEDIIKLSDVLECSTDDLLGKEKKHHEEDPFEDAEALMFSDKEGFDNLPEEEKETVKKQVDDFLSYILDQKKKDKYVIASLLFININSIIIHD